MKNANDMTAGRPLGLLLRFSLPIVVGELFQQLYTMADSIVVGRLIGINAFAAVGAASHFYWLALVVVFGFSRGFSTLFAQLFGAKNQAALKKAFAISIWLAGGIGLVFSVVFVAFTRPVLAAMATPADILGDTVFYLQYLFSGLVITFGYTLAAAAFRALGDSKTPLYALILASVLNVALDIVLIKVTTLGVAAAALATVMAQLFSLLYCLVRFERRFHIRFQKTDFAPDKIILKNLLRLGAPIGLCDVVIVIGSMVVQYVINGYGVLFIAGIAAAKKIYSLLFVAGNAVEGAIATFVAQNYGAGRYERIKAGMRTGRHMMLAGAAGVILLMLVFARPLFSFFVVGNPAEVAVMIDVALRQLYYCLALLPFLYMLFLYRAGLQGMGNVSIPMLSGFTETILRIATVFILPRFLGEAGVFIAEVVGWPVVALELIVAYRAVYRQRCQGQALQGVGTGPLR